MRSAARSGSGWPASSQAMTASRVSVGTRANRQPAVAAYIRLPGDVECRAQCSTCCGSRTSSLCIPVENPIDRG